MFHTYLVEEHPWEKEVDSPWWGWWALGGAVVREEASEGREFQM